MRVIVADQDGGAPVTHSNFSWMLPGEKRVAIWAAGRAKKVQGNTRDLVSGSYIIVAALWGLLGAVVMLAGALVDTVGRAGSSALIIFVAGAALLAVGFLRQLQSRHARKQDPADA
jgi:Flp pilus assembly protein TadB